MAFAIKARLVGVEQALANLGEMTRTVRNKILRKAVNEASRPVLQAARSLVPKGTGMLKKSLAVRVQTYRSSGVVVGIIGPRTGTTKTRQGRAVTAFGRKIEQTGQSPSHYAHLIEFGHAQIRIKKKKVLSDGSTVYGTVVRAQPARPFLRPAFEQNKGAVIDVMNRRIAEEIEKAAREMKK